MDVALVIATLADYHCIQNMARFYVYDLSRECGFISKDWNMPETGLYESFDFKGYFEDPLRRAYLIKVDQELAGFVLIHPDGITIDTNWTVGEFFILAKFQDKSIGRKVAYKLFDLHPGRWELTVIPENKSALSFWRRCLDRYTENSFIETIVDVSYDMAQPKRILISFDTQAKKVSKTIVIKEAAVEDCLACVTLSYQKRKDYEKAQPQFWASAGEKSNEGQLQWFETLVEDQSYLFLTAWKENRIIGFIIGKVISAPEVYNPKGFTLMIDDFCVTEFSQWSRVGRALFEAICPLARALGASQSLIVCGAHDRSKKEWLLAQGLSAASIWYVGGIK